mmetsp:Transcript_32621/g.68955  ORF Transcript_32621/g.68955 Transcript_32621/m.68955 type:complete len:436 (+) Transcript_32621:1-1308(+)
MDRSLYEGVWLKLSTDDFDYRVVLSVNSSDPPRDALRGDIMCPPSGQWEPEDCVGKICIVDVGQRTGSHEIADISRVVFETTVQIIEAEGVMAVFILPDKVDLYSPSLADLNVDFNSIGGDRLEQAGLQLEDFCFGVMQNSHGAHLAEHLKMLVDGRIEEAIQEALERGDHNQLPAEVKDWREMREDYTGRKFYFNPARPDRPRFAEPIIEPRTMAELVEIREDAFVQRLQALLGFNPKAIIVAQQSWRPDPDFVDLSEHISIEGLTVPVAMVGYEAGVELRRLCEVHQSAAVIVSIAQGNGPFFWGNGSQGQLGLENLENHDVLLRRENEITGETFKFAMDPRYLAHLHEMQVNSIACGAGHSLASTEDGEVFSWGNTVAVGGLLPAAKQHLGQPEKIDQLEGLVAGKRVFAGANNSFVLGDMPYQSILGPVDQ